MPDFSEVFLEHSRDVEASLLQQSVVGWASRCACGDVKSEIYECLMCPKDSQGGEVGLKSGLDASKWKFEVLSEASVSQFGSTLAKDIKPYFQPANTGASTSANAHDSVANRDSKRSRDSSPDPSVRPRRGRPRNGSKPKSSKTYAGIRKRRGVRGYLVEIKPPRWKKTIWIGTFNTDAEAAGAYDAGIFYTKKKGNYNFPSLVEGFPPLPAGLIFDRAEDAEKIKAFVKMQAAEAAVRIKNGDFVSQTNDNSRSPIDACKHADNSTNNRVVEDTSCIPSREEAAQPGDFTPDDFSLGQYPHLYSLYDQETVSNILNDYFHDCGPQLPPCSPPTSFEDHGTNPFADHGVNRILPFHSSPELEDF